MNRDVKRYDMRGDKPGDKPGDKRRAKRAAEPLVSRTVSRSFTKLGALAACGAFAAALGASLRAGAATPSEAPPACRQQVDAAVHALEPACAAPSRRFAPGAPGTLEHAVAAYVPSHFHDVEEGVLPAPRAGAVCPSEMALVANRFCVDRFEGTLVELQDDGRETAHSPYEPPLDDHVYFARSARGEVPQGYVSAAQAERACHASKKRLCAPVEWRAACGGSQGTTYPYGPTRVEGRCHDRGAAPMLVFHADTLKRGWGPLELNDPRLNQLEGTVAKTGAFPDCVNDFGVFDMVGNLDEWTADPNGTFQGGYWLDTSQHGEGCAYRTIAHGFGYHDYSTGFRCCADVAPEPTRASGASGASGATRASGASNAASAAMPAHAAGPVRDQGH